MRTGFYLLFIFFELFVIWLPGISYSQSFDANRLTNWLDTLQMQERLFLQTGRDIYVSGNNLFFATNNAGLPDYNQWLSSKIVYMALTDVKGDLIVTKKLRLKNRKARGHLTIPDTVSTGIYQLISFTSWMKNPGKSGAASRELLVVNKFDQDFPSVFGEGSTNSAARPEEPLNISEYFQQSTDQSISIKTNASSYNARESIQLNIGWVPKKGIDSVVLMTLRVAPDKAFLGNHEILSTKVNKASNSRLNNLRMMPELEEYIFQGRLIEKATGKPVVDEKILLAKPDSIVNGQYAQTGPQGNFYFRLKDYFLGDSVNLQVQSRSAGDYQFVIADKYAIEGSFAPHTINISSGTREYIKQSQEVAKINTIYGLDYTADAPENQLADRNVYQIYREPDVSFNLAEYVPFKNLRTIFRNIVSSVKIKPNDSVFNVSIKNKYENLLDLENPALFLDGIKIPYLDPILHLGSEGIARMEILTAPRFYGNEQYEGILALFTKEQEIHNYPMPKNSKWFTLQEMGAGSNLKVPNYPESPEDTGFIPAFRPDFSPDFRQLLYWDPDLSLPEDQKITFCAGDLTGKFRAQVTAITAHGEIIKGSTTFTVKKN